MTGQLSPLNTEINNEPLDLMVKGQLFINIQIKNSRFAFAKDHKNRKLGIKKVKRSHCL